MGKIGGTAPPTHRLTIWVKCLLLYATEVFLVVFSCNILVAIANWGVALGVFYYYCSFKQAVGWRRRRNSVGRLADRAPWSSRPWMGRDGEGGSRKERTASSEFPSLALPYVSGLPILLACTSPKEFWRTKAPHCIFLSSHVNVYIISLAIARAYNFLPMLTLKHETISLLKY